MKLRKNWTSPRIKPPARPRPYRSRTPNKKLRRPKRKRQQPVAAVELRPGATATASALLEHAAALLAPYEIPVAIEVLKELPRTDSGKVDLIAMSEILRAATAADR